MKKNAQDMHHVPQTPHRVAARMEGAVKNRGTQSIKKAKGG